MLFPEEIFRQIFAYIDGTQIVLYDYVPESKRTDIPRDITKYQWPLINGLFVNIDFGENLSEDMRILLCRSAKVFSYPGIVSGKLLKTEYLQHLENVEELRIIERSTEVDGRGQEDEYYGYVLDSLTSTIVAGVRLFPEELHGNIKKLVIGIESILSVKISICEYLDDIHKIIDTFANFNNLTHICISNMLVCRQQLAYILHLLSKTAPKLKTLELIDVRLEWYGIPEIHPIEIIEEFIYTESEPFAEIDHCHNNKEMKKLMQLFTNLRTAKITTPRKRIRREIEIRLQSS